MSKRSSHDETEYQISAKQPAFKEPSFFDAPPDLAPDLRIPAPSAPGSESSRLAAVAADGPFRRASWRRIMLALAAAGRPLTREELSERTAVKESSLCARLKELRPDWIQVAAGAGESSSHVAVDRYELTRAGRERCKTSNVAVA